MKPMSNKTATIIWSINLILGMALLILNIIVYVVNPNWLMWIGFSWGSFLSIFSVCALISLRQERINPYE